jgi:hypothetical protein
MLCEGVLRLSLLPSGRFLQAILDEIIGNLGRWNPELFGLVVQGGDDQARQRSGVVLGSGHRACR